MRRASENRPPSLRMRAAHQFNASKARSATTPLVDLLDDRRLDGTTEIVRQLAPRLNAVVIDDSDFAAAHEVIRQLCASWGGSCSRLYESTRQADSLPALLEADLRTRPVNTVVGCGVLAKGARSARSNLEIFPDAGPFVEPLLPALIAANQDENYWGQVSVTRVPMDDPWALAYLGVLGDLPDEPLPRGTAQIYGLREGLSWDDVLAAEFVQCSGSADELLERMRDRSAWQPAQLSCALLELEIAPRFEGIVFDGQQLPAPQMIQHLVGPNCASYTTQATSKTWCFSGT